MGGYFDKIDRFAIALTRSVIRFRYLIVLFALLTAIGIGSGGKHLEFSNNYRVFFSDENPELKAFENLQATYTKNDNFLFVIEPPGGEVFTQESLEAIKQLTEEAWQIPYTIRVDSLSNFQHTYGIDDDLIVEDLVLDTESLTARELETKNGIALNEPLLVKQLLTTDNQVSAINVTLQYPEQSLLEVPEAVAKARELRDQIESNFPGTKVWLTGVSMLNNAFSEAGFGDMGTLVPTMFLVILAITLLILRSFTATFATLVVIMLSSMVGMGFAGFSGIKLTPISGSAPIIILTLAIADSIHILISLRTAMREGMEKTSAIIEAIRVNFLPVTITSLTTIIGFLALNFSDSPPFWHLGNITSVGILAAWVFSLTLLPAIVRILPYRVKPQAEQEAGTRSMDRLADFVTRYPKQLILAIGTATAVFITFIPSIEFNDQWIEYFDERIEFRRESDQALQHFGMYPIEFSVPAQDSGGVSEPEYLRNLENFTEFLRQQDNVVHVYSISDIMKRLNKNLHGDDDSYYRTPSDRELSAQYLLLYELSLPYGLDLNDRINIDKSATRVTATLGNTSTADTKAFLETTNAWILENFPEYMQSTRPTSAQVMFTYITERNVNNMIGGTVAAILVISLIMVMALRSVHLGILSLVPNGLPILATFGTWALLVGEVGFSVATVASISLGIIVDDTVHFMSKYVRARSENGLTAEDAVRYAFHNVGVAILVNTVILSIGFLVLTTSAFKVNADMGLLTALSIVFALILDFLFLPALLMVMGRQQDTDITGDKSVKTNLLTKAQSATAVLMMTTVVGLGGILATPDSLASVEITPVRGDSPEQRKGFEIAACSDRSDRGYGDNKVELTMVLRNAAGKETSRNLAITTLEVTDESVGDKSLVVFNKPRDIEGTALLSHAKILDPDDQWLFLPALKRVKRISSANKSGPFVGSEFAFEDFTATELNKYDYEFIREEQCGDLKCDVVARYPRYKNSGYTRQLAWVDQTDHQLRKVEFYDRRNALLKTLILKDYRLYQGQFWRSHRLEMVNHQTNKSTDLIYGEYQFSVGLNQNDFVKGRLSRLR